MTFPLMPVVSPRIGVAPTISYIGGLVTTGDGFPTGSLTFTSGTKMIVLCCEMGGTSASGVTVGGVACTSRVATNSSLNKTASIWTLVTSASGSLVVSGSGGMGRSRVDAYEVRGYTSSTPFSTAVVLDSGGTTAEISDDLSSGMLVVGCGVGPYATVNVTASKGPVPVDRYARYEDATSHYSWYQRPTEQGTTTYTVTFSASGNSANVLCAWR